MNIPISNKNLMAIKNRENESKKSLMQFKF